ncbi:MAG: putative bifunctional diguanylate cyclase/phosphodiesterase, partial [Gemmatimonadales bacterium]
WQNQLANRNVFFVTLVTYASLIILLVTVGWSIVLLVRLSDPRLRALTALLSAVALSRVVVLLDPSGSWSFARSMPVDQVPALGVSVLAILVLSLLDQTLSRASAARKTIHDPLTGLPNRAHFLDLVERTLLRARQDEATFSVMLFGLDHFQRVNASHGRIGGDQLLTALSHRLLRCVRPEDTVARLGGDEFGILLSLGHGARAALRVVERIEAQLQEPFRIAERDVFATASIGIASSETPYQCAEDLLRDGETAMRRAKASGGGNTYEFFDPGMHQRVVVRLQLEADIRAALQDKDFRLVFWPLVSLSSGRIEGFEALVRWEHSFRGMMLPSQFIHVAEESGLIVPLGDWILREACRQILTWRKLFPEETNLSVSVNLSARQFEDPHIVEQVAGALIGSPPGAVILEITESMLMQDIESCIDVLRQLRELGTKIHIDDFGTGYSSLSYLHRIPFDALKIDRSFISDASSTQNAVAIVRTIIRLASDLSVEVVAEGVDTQEQAEWLKSLNCQYAQGNLYSEPVDVDDATKLLQAQAEPRVRTSAGRATG